MEATSNGTAQAWRERITSQQACGQSIRAWCRENSRHEHAFYWWRARLGLSPRSTRKRRPVKPVRFAEVVVNRAEPMCLRLAGGRELVLPASMGVEQVAKLVRAIEQFNRTKGDVDEWPFLKLQVVVVSALCVTARGGGILV